MKVVDGVQSLAVAERQLYDNVWALDTYGDHSPGETRVPLFINMTGATPGETVLDAGCGSGRGSLALMEAGFLVTATDLTDSGLCDEACGLVSFEPWLLWDERADKHAWVYCTDVLEHVDTSLTMLVARQLVAASMRGVFIAVSTMPDHYGAWVGEALHKTIQPFTWWRDRLNCVGDVVDARDLLNCACFLVVPR